MEGSEGLDIPLIRLRPLRERKVSKREFNRILASIKAVGLIEPLVVGIVSVMAEFGAWEWTVEG